MEFVIFLCASKNLHENWVVNIFRYFYLGRSVVWLLCCRKIVKSATQSLSETSLRSIAFWIFNFPCKQWEYILPAKITHLVGQQFHFQRHFEDELLYFLWLLMPSMPPNSTFNACDDIISRFPWKYSNILRPLHRNLPIYWEITFLPTFEPATFEARFFLALCFNDCFPLIATKTKKSKTQNCDVTHLRANIKNAKKENICSYFFDMPTLRIFCSRVNF